MAGVPHSHPRDLHRRILNHHLFDHFFRTILVINLVLVVIETDATAGNDGQPPWVDPLSWTILALFVFELLLRLYVMRLEFWFDGFNVFDFFIVTADLFMNALTLCAGESLPDIVLQIARLGRLARTMKAFRMFPALSLQMSRLVATFKGTFWRALLLLATLFAWSTVAVWFIHPLNLQIAEGGEYENCDHCSQAYASVSEAMFTLCLQIITIDGWGVSIKPVIEQYPMSVTFYIAVFTSVAMAMLNLVIGSVSDVATQLHDRLEEHIEYEYLARRMVVQRHLHELPKAMGKDIKDYRKEEVSNEDNGDDDFLALLSDMDISEERLRFLWAVLDADNSGIQRAPRAFIAESLALQWGIQNCLENADDLQSFG